MEEDTKRRFKEEFDETVHDVMVNFGKSEEIARLIVGTVICNTLKKLQIDTDELLFIEFYKKYVHEPKTLSFDDFTVSQLKQIIDETPMSNSDRQIAYKMFIERKTQLDIADEVGFSEPRSIGNNKDHISNRLKVTASKLYKN